jgi:hypothetical protein
MAYIGKSPTGSGVRQRYHFTATGGETSLSGADDNSKTLKFTDGEYVDVYLNGILLVQGTDYGVGTTNTISSLAALAANDIVEVVVYDIYNVAKINSEAVRARHYYTATGGETSIGTSQIAGLSFAANADIDVSLNGISLVAGTDYNTTTANTVGGLSALSAGNVIEIVIYEKFQLADALSKAAGGTVSGAVTASGGLNVGTIKEATGTTTAMTIDSSGRILTPARPAFRARLSSILTAVDYSSAKTKITFGIEDFDVGGNYDNANHKFVAPITGYYFISYQIYYSAVTTATQITASLYIDGVESTSFGTAADPQGGNVYTPQFSSVISLTAGEEVEVYSQVIGDNSVNVNTAGTFFSGFLVG